MTEEGEKEKKKEKRRKEREKKRKGGIGKESRVAMFVYPTAFIPVSMVA